MLATDHLQVDAARRCALLLDCIELGDGLTDDRAEALHFAENALGCPLNGF